MYITLMSIQMKQQFQYRASILFRLIGNFILIYIKIAIWKALLTTNGEGDYSFLDLVSYTVISLIFDGITNNTIAQSLATMVRDGSISLMLIKPIRLKWYLFYQQLSENTFYTLFSTIPVAILAVKIWSINTFTLLNVCLGIVAFVFALILSFTFQYIIGLLAFWFKDATYSKMLVRGLMGIFSGSLIPLWFYPEFLKNICDLLPFQYMIFVPISIFLGEYDLQKCVYSILLQLFWIFVMYMLEHFIWKNIQKDIEVYGG